jgi:hypothetical protein
VVQPLVGQQGVVLPLIARGGDAIRGGATKVVGQQQEVGQQLEVVGQQEVVEQQLCRAEVVEMFHRQTKSKENELSQA